MNNDIYVYLVDFPRGIRETVTPCYGGYTVYIDSKLDKASQLRAYHHALRHIERGDFEKDLTADQIEWEADHES